MNIHPIEFTPPHKSNCGSEVALHCPVGRRPTLALCSGKGANGNANIGPMEPKMEVTDTRPHPAGCLSTCTTYCCSTKCVYFREGSIGRGGQIDFWLAERAIGGVDL